MRYVQHMPLLYVAILIFLNSSAIFASEIHDAVQTQNLAEVKRLVLNDPKSVSRVDFRGNTPLHFAALYEDKAIIEFLLSQHANINAENKQGYTPLHLAEVTNIPEVQELLEAHGAKDTHPDEPPIPIDANYTYEFGPEPKPPTPFPSQYKDYQILPGSVAPNGKYAMIYPKRNELYNLKDYGLYLTQLNPFTIMRKVPLDSSDLAMNARCGYGVTWQRDSSAVAMIEDIKWGVDKVYVIQIVDGIAQKPLDLTEKIRTKLYPYYAKSHAGRYNDYFDYIFDSGYGDDWEINDSGQVLVDCTANTDPKDLDKVSWKCKFIGFWDISNHEFIKEKIHTVPKIDWGSSN